MIDFVENYIGIFALIDNIIILTMYHPNLLRMKVDSELKYKINFFVQLSTYIININSYFSWGIFLE